MNKKVSYMERAIELAKMGRGNVSPNPMVGCVLVKNENVIGEGYHEKYGGPHAEEMAINNSSTPRSFYVANSFSLSFF